MERRWRCVGVPLLSAAARRQAGFGRRSQLKVQSAHSGTQKRSKPGGESHCGAVTGRRVLVCSSAAARDAQCFIGCRLVSSTRVRRRPWPRQQPCATPCRQSCALASLPAGARGSSTRQPCRRCTCRNAKCVPPWRRSRPAHSSSAGQRRQQPRALGLSELCLLVTQLVVGPPGRSSSRASRARRSGSGALEHVKFAHATPGAPGKPRLQASAAPAQAWRIP